MYDDITELFLTNFHKVARIGATAAGGVHRQAATVEDQQTRDWFANLAAERKWPVQVDQIGNMFATVQLTDAPDARSILVGSHLDSQPFGRSEEHTSELQSRFDLVCRLLLEKKKHQ